MINLYVTCDINHNDEDNASLLLFMKQMVLVSNHPACCEYTMCHMMMLYLYTTYQELCWLCMLSSFELYFQKRQNNYDVRHKNQFVVPVVRLCLGEKAVRVTGASLWNRLHKDMVQYRLMKCFKGKLKNYYISKYHMWCIDIWSCCVVI